MSELWHDLRLALRSLRQSPGFALVVIACLGLGFGGAAAGFSLVRGVVLAPLPYERPAELVRIWNQFLGLDLPRLNASALELVDYRGLREVWSSVEAYVGPTEVGLIDVGEPERVRAAIVTPGLLALLGARPERGRDFRLAEGVAGNDKVCLLSHAFWQRRFGGRADVLGRKILLEEEGHEVIGVLPASFRFPEGQVDLLAPLALATESPRDVRGLRLIGRLAGAVTLAQAQERMDELARGLARAYPDVYRADARWGVQLVPLAEEVTGPFRSSLWLLLAGVGLVLLIACANVAGLLVARGVAREGWLVLRKALGASSWQLIRPLLLESLWLALAGALLGLLLAWLAVPALVRWAPVRLPEVRTVAVDGVVVGVTLLVALLATVGCTAWPALQAARADLRQAMSEGGRSATGSVRGRRARHVFVVAEIALASTLLVAAGLLASSFRAVQRVDPGFETADRATLQVLLPSRVAASERPSLLAELLAALEREPEIAAAAAISNLPLASQGNTLGFEIVGRDDPQQGRAGADYRVITADYHRVLGIPLIAGRYFGTEDRRDSGPVVLIDRLLAERYWPRGGAVGAQLQMGADEPPFTVVGVVGSVHHHGLDAPARGHVYFVYPQDPVRGMTLVAHGRAGATNLGASLRRAVQGVDGRIALPAVRTLAELVERSLGGRRFALWLVGCFSAVALLLAALGVYGVLTYSLARRSRELGVRLALGGSRRDLAASVVTESLRLSLLGIGAGLALGLLVARTLAAFLFEIGPLDWVVYLGAGLSMLAVAGLAALLPTLRATRTDPVVALRSG